MAMTSENARKTPQIVLFGDSLTEWSFDEDTQGFGRHLEHLYKGEAEIVNEGYAGYTSSQVQSKFDTLVSRISQPDAPRTLFITIFLGANDACFVGRSEYVPLPQFETNIRGFIDSILSRDALRDVKIVLITPPPINIPDPVAEDDAEGDLDLGPAMAAALAAARPDPKQEQGYRTYMSKKRYADAIMRIARSYEAGEGQDRVLGLDYWKALIDAGLVDQGRNGDDADAYDEERLPGCGLATARTFREGYFTDGLHLDRLAYPVLSKTLVGLVLGKWPALAPHELS